MNPAAARVKIVEAQGQNKIQFRVTFVRLSQEVEGGMDLRN